MSFQKLSSQNFENHSYSKSESLSYKVQTSYLEAQDLFLKSAPFMGFILLTRMAITGINTPRLPKSKIAQLVPKLYTYSVSKYISHERKTEFLYK